MTVLERRRRVTVIGAGVIGLSWARLFLDHGLEVCVSDPAPEVEARVRELGPGARFEADLAAAVREADVVQESGPDRLAFKQELWVAVEQACPDGALLLSSSSGITASRQSKRMQNPGRLLIGHPFNPPHILPLVEVVPTAQAPAGLADEAMAFYLAVGKHPVLLAKEVPGFVANRLQAAFLRECVWLVRSGAATPEQIDDIVTHSLGPRWASDGPFASAAMGGGPKGFEGFLDHFGQGLQLLWAHTRIRPVILSPWLKRSLTKKVERGLRSRPLADLEADRDRRLKAVLEAVGRDGS